MTVTTLNRFISTEDVEVPADDAEDPAVDIDFIIESPVEGIDLVFEEIDLYSFFHDSTLDRKTVRRHLRTLRRGYGYIDARLPVQFAVIGVQVEADEHYTIGTSSFVDMLFEARGLQCEWEEIIDEDIDEIAA